MKDRETTSPDESRPATQRRKWWRWVANLVLCLVIIAVGLGLAAYIKNSAPKAQKRVPARNNPRVETLALFPGEHRVAINAMGSVIPAREMTLKARVGGQVQSLHPEFMAGGVIGRGQRILKIDPRDYRLALARQESQLIEAQYELKVEMGYQEVARREWKLINAGKPANPADVELALRKPHLAKAKSDLAAAQAELDQARLSLERTDVTAPFNVVVREKHVEIGSQVSTQEALAELVGIDAYWIRVALPVDRLRWIQIPTKRSQAGAPATVHYRGHRRTGRVIRMLGDLEAKGRMARILVSIEDPLGIANPQVDSPPFLIGEYVRVVIQGQRLEDVYRIPRTALRDESTIWLVDPDETLHIKPVETIWGDDHFVLVQNQLGPGDRLIISDLATPVDGMPVEAIGDPPASRDGAPKTKDQTHGS